jgi:hypothetical protein
VALPGVLKGRQSTSGAVCEQSGWLFSWPLLAALAAYLYAFSRGNELLIDGDTYWHIATGRWMIQHGTIPSTDPFSHTMPGATWTAHEWLSDLILATAHQWGGWTLVLTVTALALALTLALLTRALLKWLEPIYALLFAGLAIALVSGHLLARPHILAMPVMMSWTIALVQASEAKRSPPLWTLTLLILWANLHGGFTLGLALAGAFAMEALSHSDKGCRAETAKSWGFFLLLAVASALVTPHGVEGILFTWHILFNLGSALVRIGEWRSPDFQTFHAFELWILGALALAMYQGLRLPLMRLVLVLGFLHLALKHVRNVELIGLLTPLFVAGPFAEQWRQARRDSDQVEGLDRFFQSLARPASRRALLAGSLVLAVAPVWSSRLRPAELPETVVPEQAIAAVQKAGITGPVLNGYSVGGYLIYRGIPVFVDGRADMYGEAFMKQYAEALELRTPDGLEKLMDKYGVTWTILETQSATVALLDHLPNWRRLHADKMFVVHVRNSAPLLLQQTLPVKENRP